MVKARDLGYPADSLVCSQHNRALPGGGKLWDKVMEQEALGRIRFMLPSGRGRKTRTVEQDIRVQRIALSDKAKGVIEVSCLVASEVNARRGGFLGRKGDGEPGARTLWLGLQEIAVFVEGAHYAREFGVAGTCV